MPVRVYLGSEVLATAEPEQLPALQALARGLGLAWHPDPADDALYIASPLAGRAVAVTGDAPGPLADALRRRLTAAGATLADSGALDLCLLLTPGPEPLAHFSLRRPLASLRLARRLAEALAGTVGLTAWIVAPAWCPAVQLCYPPDALATRLFEAVLRCFAAPLPPLLATAFSALAAALPAARDASAGGGRAHGGAAGTASGPAPDGAGATVPAPAASGPVPAGAGSAGEPLRQPLVLGTLQRSEAESPAPPPLSPPFGPPGSGVIRVFSPTLAARAPQRGTRRVFRHEKQAPPTVASRPGPGPIGPRPVADSEPVMRVLSLSSPPPEPPLPELHTFRPVPGMRVPLPG